MTTQRDDLAREIFIADNRKQPREQSIVDWDWFNETPRFTVRVDHYKDLADGLIAAGYGLVTLPTWECEYCEFPTDEADGKHWRCSMCGCDESVPNTRKGKS